MAVSMQIEDKCNIPMLIEDKRAISMIIQDKCISCEKYYKSFDNYCSECYMLENPLFKTYSLEIYDNIKDIEVKKKYFGKYSYKFWEDFCKHSQLNHMITHSSSIAKTILNKCLEEAFKENKIGILFLNTNGHGIYRPTMFTSRTVDDFLNGNIYAFNELDQKTKYNLTIILGQTVINPWNSNNQLILKEMGNNGKIPNTTKELFTLWFNNKKKVQEYFRNEIVFKCSCGYNKFLKHYNITKSKKENLEHDHIDEEVECIDYIMKKIKL